MQYRTVNGRLRVRGATLARGAAAVDSRQYSVGLKCLEKCRDLQTPHLQVNVSEQISEMSG